MVVISIFSQLRIRSSMLSVYALSMVALMQAQVTLEVPPRSLRWPIDPDTAAL